MDRVNTVLGTGEVGPPRATRASRSPDTFLIWGGAMEKVMDDSLQIEQDCLMSREQQEPKQPIKLHRKTLAEVYQNAASALTLQPETQTSTPTTSTSGNAGNCGSTSS